MLLKEVQNALEKLRFYSIQSTKKRGQHTGRPCRHIFPEICGLCRDLIKLEQKLKSKS